MAHHTEENTSKTKLIVNVSTLSGQSFGYHHNEEMVDDSKKRQELSQAQYLAEEKFLTSRQDQREEILNLNFTQQTEDMTSFFDKNTTLGTPTKNNSVESDLKTVYVAPSPFSCPERTQSVTERPNIQELRKKYESPEHELATRSPKKSKSLKTARKSMVAQITKMFNTKIAQLMRQDTDVLKYKTLNNELSPDAKPAPKAIFKPVAKPRNKLPIYRPKLFSSPFQSPRLQRKPQPKASCLVAEEVFRKLSVKDKALLYNKFIEDLSTKNPQFAKQAEYLMDIKMLKFGEVVDEKQPNVQRLAQKIERKCESNQASELSSAELQNELHSSSQKEQELVEVGELEDAPPSSAANLEDSMHLSSLTVVLKSSCKEKEKRHLFSSSKFSKKREVRFMEDPNIAEPSQKRNNNQLRSTLKIDVYAPPKKIRRTHDERLASNKVFQKLFYTWLKEKNGIDFDITNVDSNQKPIKIQEDKKKQPIYKLESDEAAESSNKVERLLEEVSSKLETADVKCPRKVLTTKAQKDSSETDSSIHQAVLEVVVPLEVKIPLKSPSLKKRPAPPIPSPAKTRVKKAGKARKGPAPPIPSSSNTEACISQPSPLSSARHSDADDFESGLSCIPKPPENELQKSHDQNPNALSEHQLRVQASLQRLNIPDWFRHYNQTTVRSPDGNNAAPNTYKPGNFSRKRTSEASGRWTGLNSKTTSLSSLGSQRSDRSPLLLSPSAHSHHGGQTSMGAHQHHQHHAGTTSAHGAGGGSTFSRWSTSHLNSSQTSPSCSQRGSFSRGGPVNSSFISVVSGQSNSSAVRSSFRQPYLGWRSQEKLSQRTPHERLASSLLSTQPRPCSTPKNSNGAVKQHPVTPEIQSSIKEVTSAIVHYVNDQTQQQRSRSTSPNSRKCWLESSFVGTRPLDSPQTPIIENTTTFSASAGAAAALTQFNSGNSYNYNYNSNSNNNNSISSGYYNNSSATSSLYSAATTTNADVLRMNGLSCGVAPERSMSSASLEDVLASLLGLPYNTAGTGASTSDAYTRSTTGDSASESLVTLRHMPQTATPTSLQVDPHTEQRLRRRSEGDAPKQQQQQQQQKLQQQNKQQHQQQQQQNSQNAKPNQAGDSLSAPMRRVSLGDSSESNNKTTSELQIKCRNTKCDQTATPNDAKKYYKSCHNCAHLYCSRECRRAHWEKHRKACLHSRASNLCRQVLATCKDDLDSQRHLSLLARKGFLSQGRGVVRVLFRSAEAAEGFIKHGFQCMGEASYVRWPDLMPAEMGLELYSELLKLSTEYKPDSKMLIYVAICVVSEAPGTAQAPVKWERQLVSRCAKLKLCKTILAELEQQHQALQLQQPLALVAVPEPATEILILTFNPSAHTTASRRDVILSNILGILSRRGVFLRKHYPEIYQRLQTYADGQTDKFQPVTLHPRDSQSGLSFVCIIMPVHSESGIIKMPSVADGGNRVNTIDVGAVNALANLVDDATIQS